VQCDVRQTIALAGDETDRACTPAITPDNDPPFAVDRAAAVGRYTRGNQVGGRAPRRHSGY